MKKISFSIVLISFFLNSSCTKNEDSIGPTNIEAFNSAESSSTGTAITKVIGVTGGSLSVPTASINVVVPAGAMAAGASLTVQPTKNAFNEAAQGMSISGVWTKPITIELKYPADEPNPANYALAVRLPNGYWVSSKKSKVNTATKIVSVKLGTTPSTSNASSRVMASNYSLAFAKRFYIKPNQASVKVGETVNFVAYALEGQVPMKGKEYKAFMKGDVAGSNINTKKIMPFDDDDVVVALNSPIKPIDDDEIVVPLTPKSTITDDDEVVVPIFGKEYPFANTKAGYTREWTVNGVGTVTKTGKFTAPKNEADKGKKSLVFFSSKNNKSGDSVIEMAEVTIDDGLERYIGTGTRTDEYEYVDSYGYTISGKIVDEFKFELVAVPFSGSTPTLRFEPVPEKCTATRTVEYSKGADIYGPYETNMIISPTSLKGKNDVMGRLDFLTNTKQYYLYLTFAATGGTRDDSKGTKGYSICGNKSSDCSQFFIFNDGISYDSAPKYDNFDKLSGSHVRIENVNSQKESKDKEKITNSWNIIKVK